MDILLAFGTNNPGSNPGGAAIPFFGTLGAFEGFKLLNLYRSSNIKSLSIPIKEDMEEQEWVWETHL